MKYIDRQVTEEARESQEVISEVVKKPPKCYILVNCNHQSQLKSAYQPHPLLAAIFHPI